MTTKPKPKPAPAVPPPAPRQPLTKKRKAAIKKYVDLTAKLGQYVILDVVVERTLKAEKMKAETLYEWLQTKGYKWNRYAWRLKS